MYYFAYGSNMDEKELTTYIQRKGGDSSAVSNPRWARLDDWRLVFNHFSHNRRAGAANIERAEGQCVEGILWDATEEALDVIDCKEGRPGNYERICVCVSDEQGQLLREVVTYEVVQKLPHFCAPKRNYLDLMKRAASRFGFSEKYRRILNAIETVECESRGG
jgi:hypothetical protein